MGYGTAIAVSSSSENTAVKNLNAQINSFPKVYPSQISDYLVKLLHSNIHECAF